MKVEWTYSLKTFREYTYSLIIHIPCNIYMYMSHSVSIRQIFWKFPARASQEIMKIVGNVAETLDGERLQNFSSLSQLVFEILKFECTRGRPVFGFLKLPPKFFVTLEPCNYSNISATVFKFS